MKTNVLIKITLLNLIIGLIYQTSFAGYKLVVPSKRVSSPAPLFVVLHGCLTNADRTEKGTRFSEWAEREGFYVMYPEAPDSSGWTRCWRYYNQEEQQIGQGDAYRIIQDLEEIKKNHPIDANRVYLTGMSSGAAMVAILASCYPKHFQGAAMHSGIAYGLSANPMEGGVVAKFGPLPMMKRNKSCRPSDFKGKFMAIHGNSDKMVSPSNLEIVLKDFLVGAKMNSTFVNPKESNKKSYVKLDFKRDNKSVGLALIVDGLDHSWSGGDDVEIFNDPNGPDATRAIIEFLLDKSADK